jgi:LPXTG-site transpeptidase (sortase) family protein
MISKFFLLIGLFCLGLYGFFTAQAHFQQQILEQQLYQPVKLKVPHAGPARGRTLKEGDLFGRLEIPRLNMSVMVMEGDQDKVLRLGAGHIPGTPLALAGHRDTFFRPLKDIRMSDSIVFTTPESSAEYRVVSTKIVGPTDTYVLDQKTDDTMTLITCYPFTYIGPAPKRFVVEAVKN